MAKKRSPEPVEKQSTEQIPLWKKSKKQDQLPIESYGRGVESDPERDPVGDDDDEDSADDGGDDDS